MFGIGIVGAILRAYAFPLAPIVLGLVLGGQLETEFRRALIGSRGDWWVFVDRPLAASILLCAVAVVLLPVVTRLRAFWRARRAALT